MRKLAFSKSVTLGEAIEALHRERDHEIQMFFPAGSRIFADPGAVSVLHEEALKLEHAVTVITPDQEGQRQSAQSGFRALNERGEDVAAHVHPKIAGGFLGIIGAQKERFSAVSSQPVKDTHDIVRPQDGSESVVGYSPETPVVKSAGFTPLEEEDILSFAEERETESGYRGEKQVFWGGRFTLRQLAAKHFAIFAALVVLVLGGGVAFVALPKAEVEITPRAESVNLSLPVVVAKNPGDGKKILIAGQTIEVSERVEQSYGATGEQALEEKARGTIKVFNNYGASAQTLVASTRFVSESGKLFRSTQTVVVPGASVSGSAITPSSVEVPVIAAEAGEEYNVGLSTFSIPGFQGTPKYTAFYGKSSEAMRGGAKGATKVLTEENKKNAEKETTAKTEQALERAFQAKLPQGFVVLPGAVSKVITVKTDRGVGDPGATFTAVGEGKARAMLFREDDIKKRFVDEIRGKLKEKAELLSDTVKFSYKVQKLELEKGEMQLSVAVEAKVAWRVDLPMIREEIAGKNRGEIEAFFQNHEAVEKIQVSFWPLWVGRAPQDPKRIFIRLNAEY